MKKKNYYLVVAIFLLLSPVFVFAEEKKGIAIGEPSLRLRSGPGTNYDTVDFIPYLSDITIISYDSSTENCSGYPWAKVKTTSGVEGYACSRFINESSSEQINISEAGKAMANMTDTEFDSYLNAQGFPESYKVKLKEIHKLHPTWIFIGAKTKYSWESALIEQDEFVSYYGDASPGRSFLNINQSKALLGQEGYLSTRPADYDYYTNKFIPHDGVYWFQANTQAVAHYMDPRNYLSEKSIFAFEDLTYDSSYQTEEVVKRALNSDFLKQFSGYFMKAASTYNVNPIYLASLSRQEIGTSDTNICTNGKAGVLSDGVDYTGYYNFYNIGASSSNDPKLKSLQKAKENGWDSAEKAIVNGAYIISKNYIQCGQHTAYYQKYNFSPKATKEMWHQYTTSIASLESQAATSYNSYKSLNLIENSFKFDIPIFTNMPESTPLPALGNPNNYMKEIKVNNELIKNFDGAEEKYTVNIPYTESITISGTLVATTSKVDGLGTFKMNTDTQVQKITVTSGNGLKKTYEITIIRQAKPVVEEKKEEIVNTPQEKNDEKTNENTNTKIEEQKKEETKIEESKIVEPVKEEPKVEDKKTIEPEVKKILVTEVINSSSYKINSTYITNISFGTNITTFINNLKKYNNSVNITIKNNNNAVKNNGNIVTGDKITISTGSEEKSFTVVIYGDTNGDGIVSAIDLLNVQKIIINKSNLSGAYYQAADTNKDGKISAIDLLNVQKHILGNTVISQS